MRVSVRKSDPAYIADSYTATVYLDGVELEQCFTADEELGEAHCFITDDEGKVAFDMYSDKPMEIIKKGDVKIVFSGAVA